MEAGENFLVNKSCACINFPIEEKLMNLDSLEQVLKAVSAQGYSIPQLTLLLALRNGKLTMTEAASKVGHSTAAATGSVDHLEKKRLVGREHDKEDRRKIWVSLTTNGMFSLSSLEKSINKIPTL